MLQKKLTIVGALKICFLNFLAIKRAYKATVISLKYLNIYKDLTRASRFTVLKFGWFRVWVYHVLIENVENVVLNDEPKETYR